VCVCGVCVCGVCVCVCSERKIENENLREKKVSRRGKSKSLAPASRFLHLPLVIPSDSIEMTCCHIRLMQAISDGLLVDETHVIWKVVEIV
jgi:hypothetical protein